jgi:flagellar protein FliS
MNYQQQSVAGMNPVELVVALYDGMVRFLYRAIAAVESGDVQQRRIAVKRTLDILMHLQSRLRTDVGGNSAKVLSEFYAAIFALCIEGSRLSSPDRFREAIACIRDVREAWFLASKDPAVLQLLAEEQGKQTMVMASSAAAAAEPAPSSWMA